MLTKKEQRLRRPRQTRIRIAQSRRGPFDREPYQSSHLCQRRFLRLTASKCSASASTAEADVRKELGAAGKGGRRSNAAQIIGKRIAEKAKAAGVEKVAFDRAGFAYHGRVKALAEAAREAGLQF
jgi:large subunit ribosomal protein L18